MDIYQMEKIFYLYKPVDKPFQVCPHDFDLSLGSVKYLNLSNTFGVFNYDYWGGRVLYDRLLKITKYKNQLNAIFWDLLKEYSWVEDTKPSTLQTRILYYNKFLAPVVKQDNMHKMDYGFSFQDFQDSIIRGKAILGSDSDPIVWGTNAVWIMAIDDYISTQSGKIRKQLF